MSAPDVLFALVGDVRRNSRALRQLRALAALGARVEVLTLGPPAADAVWEAGLRLRVLPAPPGAGPRFFGRMHRQVLAAARDVPARVYHASDLYTLPALQAAARRHGGRLVYDARELYPHVSATAGRPWVSAFWQLLEGRYVRRADAVFTVSPSIADHMAATYGIAPPVVLFNAPTHRPVTPSDLLRRRAAVPEGHVLLLHQGQIRPDRGGTRLVEAMRHVRGATLVFLGDGPLRPALEARAAAEALPVRFIDPVPPDDLLPVTASADVGITLLEDTCLNHRLALPNKLFEYLAAGLPVLGSDLPEIRRVIVEHDVGCVVNPADPQALRDTIQRMVDDANARRRWAARAPAAADTFGWERTSKRFIQVYQSLLSGPP